MEGLGGQDQESPLTGAYQPLLSSSYLGAMPYTVQLLCNPRTPRLRPFLNIQNTLLPRLPHDSKSIQDNRTMLSSHQDMPETDPLPVTKWQ